MSVLVLNSKPKPSKKKFVEAKAIKDPKKIEMDARRRLKELTDPIQLELDLALQGIDYKSPKEMGEELERIKKYYEYQIDNVAGDIASSWVNAVNQYNRDHTMQEMRKALGIDIAAIVDEAMKDDLEVMMLESASYIKSIPNYLVGKVAQRVVDHYKGLPMPENRTLRQQIKEEFKISDGRAKVLARDQTSKMNTSLAAIRQTNLGIDMYIWKTAEDERVVGRPGGRYPKITKLHRNHWMMQGLLCKWADPTVYSDDKGKTWKKRLQEMPQTHPGVDIMCRCRAAPYIDIEALKVKWAE